MLRSERLRGFLGNPQKVFVSLALIFGVASTVAMPLFLVPDEMVHFYRSYHIGAGHLVGKNVNGQIVSYGPELPSPTTKKNGSTTYVSARNYFKPVKKPNITTPRPTSYLAPPLMYIPQAFGIDIGRVINGSIGSMMLFGRFMNLLTYIILVWAAIKIAKMGKWVYVVVALFPVAIQQAGSLSPDVMTTGFAFVTIALMLNFFVQKSKLSRRDMLVVCLLAAGLALTKQNNILFLLPLPFLPTRLFKNKLQKLGFVCAAFGAGLGALVLWYLFVRYNYRGLSPTIEIPIPNVNGLLQFKHILKNPIAFMRVLARSFIFEGKGAPLPDFYLLSMHGVFSWISYKLPLEFIMLGYGLLTTVFVAKDNKKSDDYEDKEIFRMALIFTVLFFISVVAVAGTLYLFWSPVDAGQVNGIQGRYFIPLVPLLIPLGISIRRYFKITFNNLRTLGGAVAAVSSINLVAYLAITVWWFR